MDDPWASFIEMATSPPERPASGSAASRDLQGWDLFMEMATASPRRSGGGTSFRGAKLDPSFVVNGLIERGVPAHVAEGFAINFMDESGLNPGINEIEPIVPGSRGGFGLSQWTGPRRRALEAFAADRGVDVSDPDMQLDYLMTELQGPEARAYRAALQTQTPGEAAAVIVNKFLRPAEEHRARRERRYLGMGG